MSSDREAAIVELYSKLKTLRERSWSESDLIPELEGLTAQLRRLQDEEAEEMRQRSESSAFLKPGEGWAALEEAKRLLRKYCESD
jgi:hypothetical protein